MKLRGLDPNTCICERFVYSTSKIGKPIPGIYKLLTDTCTKVYMNVDIGRQNSTIPYWK